jgi:hypothetical protein
MRAWRFLNSRRNFKVGNIRTIDDFWFFSVPIIFYKERSCLMIVQDILATLRFRARGCVNGRQGPAAPTIGTMAQQTDRSSGYGNAKVSADVPKTLNA